MLSREEGIEHGLEDLIGGEVRGINADGVVRAAEGGVFALGIGEIAGFDLGLDRVDLIGGESLLGESSSCAFAGAGVEVEFELGLWKDDGACVAAFEDSSALVAEAALCFEQEGAYSGISGDDRSSAPDLIGADGLFDIASIEEDVSFAVDLLELEGKAGQHLCDNFLVFEGDGRKGEAEGDGPVHRACVDVGIAKGLCKALTEGAFSCASGAINCDDPTRDRWCGEWFLLHGCFGAYFVFGGVGCVGSEGAAGRGVMGCLSAGGRR